MVKNFLFTITAAILFFALISFAKADFSIQSQLEGNTVCPSSTIIINEIISTTQDSSFSASISGSASQFTTAVPLGFFLNQGQTQTIFLYITPSSKTTPGVYNLILQVTSQGTSKTATHQIIVENCHKTTLITSPVSQQSCTCEQKQINLEILNQGKYLENYVLSVEGPLAQYVSLSGSSFSMPPNSSRDVVAYVKTPCNVVGNYEISFKINADSQYASAEATSDLNLITCYDYSVNFEKTFYDLCESQKLEIPITIKNIGTTENTYKIKLGSPSWIAVDQSSLKISTNQEKTFNLIVQPSVNTQGNFTAYLEFTSEKGNVIKTAEINFNIGSCYGALVSIEKKEDKICNTLGNIYPVTITNIGKLSNTFDLVLEAPEWAALDKSQIKLDYKNQTTVLLAVNPPQDTKAATYPIIIKAIDTLSKKESQDTIQITTLTTENCYQPYITSEKDSIQVPQDTAATLLFTIDNKGFQTADYVIEISGTASTFSQINPAAIQVEPGKTQSLYLYIAPSIDMPVGNYSLSVAARLKDTTLVAKKTVSVLVTKGEGIAIQPVNYTNKTITGQVVSPEGKNFWKTIWEAIVKFFKSIFTAQPSKNETGNQTIQNLPPKLIKNVSNIEIDQGSSFTINLSEYFKDPEGKNLEFVTVKPLNISILIRGSLMTLTPSKDFQGIRGITFYATDGKTMVASNTVNITVIPSQEISPSENETENETQPIENETNMTCKYYYWFDSEDNTTCSYNQFCGLYEYQGLETFTSLEECKENLPAIENETNNQTQNNMTNVTQPQIPGNQTNLSNKINVTQPKVPTNNSNVTKPKINETKPKQNVTNQTNVTNQSNQTPTAKVSFWSAYKSYILLAILIAVIIIIIMSGLGKKILDFFEEEETEKKK
jgi:uncharacterized membrane protein